MKIIKKIWNDSVLSKVIANFIWAGLIFIAGISYLIYQKIRFAISFKSTSISIGNYLNKESSFKNWIILGVIIFTILLFINRSIFIKFFSFMGEALFNIGLYPKKYNYNFLNTNKNEIYVNTERAFNEFSIKPSNNTKQWNIIILFSHNSYNFENIEHDKSYNIKIFKNYNESTLKIESFDIEGKIIKDETKILLANYEAEEIKLHFKYSHEKGGIVLDIIRLDKELLTTDKKFGCSCFKMLTNEDTFDFDIKIYREEFD